MSLLEVYRGAPPTAATGCPGLRASPSAGARNLVEPVRVQDEVPALALQQAHRRNLFTCVVTVSRVVPISFARSSWVSRRGISVPPGVGTPCSLPTWRRIFPEPLIRPGVAEGREPLLDLDEPSRQKPDEVPGDRWKGGQNLLEALPRDDGDDDLRLRHGVEGPLLLGEEKLAEDLSRFQDVEGGLAPSARDRDELHDAPPRR